MPTIIRKFLVIAAVDGLILQPSQHRSHRGLKLEYGSEKFASYESRVEDDVSALECHGLVGLLRIPPVSYLVAISGRQVVAHVRGAPIYAITDVTFIPTTSQVEAKSAIFNSRKDVTKKATTLEGAIDSESEVSENEESQSAQRVQQYNDNASVDGSDLHESQHESPTEAEAPHAANPSSVAEDVIGRKGQYGRFAERWFSKKGWTADRRKSQGMSSDSTTAQVSKAVKDTAAGAVGYAQEQGQGTIEAIAGSTRANDNQRNVQTPAVTITLLPKLLRTTRLLLSSYSFFYSYDLDITRRLGTSPSSASDTPLYKRVDPLFFWNRHLALPLIDSSQHSYVLPIIEGFVGQKSFVVNRVSKAPNGPLQLEEPDSKEPKTDSQQKPKQDDSNFLVTLISRRSVKRPGLRYLRRGVDDEGFTANSVETEQILSNNAWTGTIHSFTQIRGSIPLFFSQSPYSFKPVPILQHSEARNQAAFERHFRDVAAKYGKVEAVLLVDKSGGEAAIGRRYEEGVQTFNSHIPDGVKRIGFEWFDFHNICRGMKFENVSLLMDALEDTLENFNHTSEIDGMIQGKQNGVFRTSCMDCLDRTNVVQSAFGQRALEVQLREEGIDIDLRTDKTTNWFNELWADNGDAISKQYSSTAALKGDYTRTRKRDYRGAINDLGLTLSRYYNNIVNDYFSQAAIDYLLGNVTVQIFVDFEDNMMSGDPGMSISKVRENAINTSTKIVVVDGDEDLVGGWTMLAPSRPNTLVGSPLEEVILLLTNSALYSVRYDWNNDKVISFERVDLRSLIGIRKGTYVTSTFTPAQMDEDKNLGFVVRYRPGKEDVARVNTRSLDTDVTDSKSLDDLDNNVRLSAKSSDAAVRILAFKALPARSSFASESQEHHASSEKEAVTSVCEEIVRATRGGEGANAHLIDEAPIISAQEARRSTGLVDQLGHALKRLVWAS